MKFILFFTLVAFVNAKCPNDCSGHGTCNAFSACECYRGFQSNDCSERTCYFGHAFIDTPQGDLNADGRTEMNHGESYQVILGSNKSFFTSTDGNTAYVAPYVTDSYFKSEETFADTFYVKNNIALEYDINANDMYGFAHACAEKEATVTHVIAFEVTSTIRDTTSYSVVEDQTKVQPTGGALANCAVGDPIFRRASADTAFADVAECNSSTSLIVGHVIGFANTNADIYIQMLPNKAAFVADNTIWCGCHGVGTFVAVAADKFDLTFPSSFQPVLSESSETGGTYSTTSVIFSGKDSQGNTNGILEENNVSKLVVCSITPSTYTVQWSNVNEWESYPSDHGVAAVQQYSKWDEAHFYRECSNKGICDRATGRCECFPGFDGEGCTRSACLNNCSGHGECRRAVDINSEYVAWDSYKTQKCICDAGYEGTDCSMRACPKGDDPVTRHNDNDEVQIFGVDALTSIKTGIDNLATATKQAWFSLEFETELSEKFTTRSINFLGPNLASSVESALESLPNSVIGDVEVNVADAGGGRKISVTFLSNSGDIPQLGGRYNWFYGSAQYGILPSRNLPSGAFSTYGFKHYSGTEGNKENATCSNRGNCDYTTGICSCFAGFTKGDCSLQNALASA